MPQLPPLIPGLENFDPRSRLPYPESFPGMAGKISTERDIYIGIIPFSTPDRSQQCRNRQGKLTPEQEVWEEAQGLMTARRLMRESQGLFWGCPEGTFHFVITDHPCRGMAHSSRNFSARLDITGNICITRSRNVGDVCAAPESFTHPVVSAERSYYDDTPLKIEPGSYVVTVTELFRWHKSQLARTNPEFVHYHIEFSRIVSESNELIHEIPWLSSPLPE